MGKFQSKHGKFSVHVVFAGWGYIVCVWDGVYTLALTVWLICS